MNSVLEEELEVIKSIYETSNISVQSSENSHQIVYEESENVLKIVFNLPLTYPVERPLSITIYVNQTRDTLGEQSSQDISEGSPGEVVLFQVIENVRSNFRRSLHEEEVLSFNTEDSISCEKELPDINIEDCNEIVVIHGPVTMEQKSSFQSHIATVHSMKEVTTFRAIVLSDKKVSFHVIICQTDDK